MRSAIRRIGLVLLLTIILIGVAPTHADDQEAKTPPIAEELFLIAIGEPAPGDIEVLVNGEFAVELRADPTAWTPINDLLVAGLNTLEFSVATGELEIDQVTFGQPMALFTFSPKADKPAFEKSRAFRAP